MSSNIKENLNNNSKCTYIGERTIKTNLVKKIISKILIR